MTLFFTPSIRQQTRGINSFVSWACYFTPLELRYLLETNLAKLVRILYKLDGSRRQASSEHCKLAWLQFFRSLLEVIDEHRVIRVNIANLYDLQTCMTSQQTRGINSFVLCVLYSKLLHSPALLERNLEKGSWEFCGSSLKVIDERLANNGRLQIYRSLLIWRISGR